MTTPPQFAQVVPGQFITSALWNAQVVAAGNFLLGSGTDGPPRFKGYGTAAQTFAHGTSFISALLDTEVYDSVGGHSGTTNTSRYTVQVPGTYLLVGRVGFGGDGTGAASSRAGRIAVNGGTLPDGSGAIEVPADTVSTNSWGVTLSGIATLTAGDYVEIQAWQSSTVNLTTTAGSMSLSVQWISN